MTRLLVLGRQPDISIAELESIYSSDSIERLSRTTAAIKMAQPIDLKNLGGTIKSGLIIKTIDGFSLGSIYSHLAEFIKNHSTDSKLNIGISFYDSGMDSNKINSQNIELKRKLKSNNVKVRVIENKKTHLNTAQIVYNKLVSKKGIEFLIVKSAKKTIIATTEDVQDIKAYTDRDYKRPKRDAKVGMLPPKLAQIIINLSRGSKNIKTIVDPFCGTGVILQEALLMNYSACGTDLSPEMVKYSNSNLEWLSSNHKITKSYSVTIGDATNSKWDLLSASIACETYLGAPMSKQAKQQDLMKMIQSIDTLHRKFLENVSKQSDKGFTMCIAVPAWFINRRIFRLPTLEKLEQLGYTRKRFVHTDSSDLIYHREDQIVGRELVVLERVGI